MGTRRVKTVAIEVPCGDLDPKVVELFLSEYPWMTLKSRGDSILAIAPIHKRALLKRQVKRIIARIM